MLKSTEIFEPKHYKTSQQVQQLSITVQNLISDINTLMSNIDNVPTANSDNLISSGAVYTALENISASGGQIQVDWNQTDSSATDYIKNKPDLSNVGAQANWNETNSNSPSYIQNKPNIPAAQVQADWNVTNSSSLSYIKNKPEIPNAQIQADWNQTNISAKDYIKNKPDLSNVGVQANWNETNTSSPSYINNKPTIPSAQVQGDWAQNDSTQIDYIKNRPGGYIIQEQENTSTLLNTSFYINYYYGYIGDYPYTYRNDLYYGSFNAVTLKLSRAYKVTVDERSAILYFYQDGSYYYFKDSSEDTRTTMCNKYGFYVQMKKNSGNIYYISTVYYRGTTSTTRSVTIEDVEIVAKIPQKFLDISEQIQSDWNQSNSSAKDYIKNKPTVYNTIWDTGSSTYQIPSIYAVYQALLAKQDNLLGVETVDSLSPTDYIFIERDGVIFKLLVSDLYNVPNNSDDSSSDDSNSADAITMENGEVLLTENGEELLIDREVEEAK